jgi:putative tryptophan/tyrosine transport system substrate-binding protein
MSSRREFITLLGGVAVAWPVAARSQSAENVRRVGILWPGASLPASPRLESFREGLREAGFIEGENLVIELRYSRTGLQHLPELAAELVRLKVEVIERKEHPSCIRLSRSAPSQICMRGRTSRRQMKQRDLRYI